MVNLLNFRVITLLLLFASLLHAEFEYSVENTNLTLFGDYNYDRVRFRGDYVYDALFGTFIADGVNYYGEEYSNSMEFYYLVHHTSDTPFQTQSSLYEYEAGRSYAKLYRAYLGYEDDAQRVLFGLQNISMGVGHIWTPTNLFNPKNIYSLEPDEILGVFALSYLYHLSDTSDMMLVLSQKEDNSLKYAFRYKSYSEFADFALSGISSDTLKMLGYEIEGNLGESGVELRSEGSYFSFEDRDIFEAIVGAEYAFEDGLTLLAEALYSSEIFSYSEILFHLDSEIATHLHSAHFYTALHLSYSFNIFLDSSLLYIESFGDAPSRYIAPTLSYTLNDYNTFTLGAMLYNGDAKSEFGMFESSYYLKWKLSF